MSTSSRIIKNTGFLYAKMAISVFISLYTTRIILNSLGSSDFGLFNVVGGAIGMLAFINASMASATQRFMSYCEGIGDNEQVKIVFNNSIVLHLLIATLVGVLLIAVEPIFFGKLLNIEADRINAAKMVYYFTIMSTIFTVMTVPYDAMLNAHENMLYYSVVGLIESFFKLIIAIFITYIESDKLIWYGGLMALNTFLIMIIMRIYCMRKYEECNINIRKFFKPLIFKNMTIFAGWNLFGSSASVISGYGSNILLNHFYGTKLNAANGICGQLNGQMLALSNNLIKAINPVIVKSEGGGNRSQMYKFTFIGCKLSVLLYTMIAIPFIIECPYILKIWLGNIPPYTITFCSISVITVLVEEIYLPIRTSIGAIGKNKMINLFTSVIKFFSLLLLLYFFTQGFPPYLLVVISLFSSILNSIFYIYYAVSNCEMNLRVFIRDILFRCLIVIIITFSIGYSITKIIDPSFIRLITVIVTCLITFFLSSFYWGLSEKEKNSIKKLLSAILKKIKFSKHEKI